MDHLDRVAGDNGCLHLMLRTIRETGNVVVFERLGFAVDSEGTTDLFESDMYAHLVEVVMRRRVTGRIHRCQDPDTPA